MDSLPERLRYPRQRKQREVSAEDGCSVAGCDSPHHGRTLCSAHYRRWLRYGDPAAGWGPTLAERFWAKVDISGPCWLWTAAKIGGYGAFWYRGRHVRAHRWSYEQVHGPIAEGLVIDHLCRTPACVNPDHLEPVTVQVNTLRGQTIPAMRAVQTSCVNGHPFDAANTYYRKTGGRVCRACVAAATRRYYQRIRKQANDAK